MTENFFPDDEPQFAPTSPSPPTGMVKNFFPEDGEPDMLPAQKEHKAAAPGALASSGENEGWLSGAAKGTGTAVIKGLANIPGAVKNYGNLVDYLMARGHSAVTGRPLEEVQRDLQQRYATASKGASSLTGGVFQAPENVLPSGEDIAAPILQKTGEYVPSTALGKAGMAGVETATSMIGPGGGARAVGAPVKAAGLLPRIAETAISPAVKAAPMNMAAGAGAEAATEATGDPLAGLAAGVAIPAVASIPAKIVRPLAKPFTQSGRETGVGEQVLKASENPEALRQKLEQVGNTQAIPGSQPTLAQWVGTDQGLHNAEMAARNDVGGKDTFAAVDKAQNTARLGTLEEAAPMGADTMKVPEAFQAHLDHIDQSTEQAVNQLTEHAQAAAPKGTQEPEDVGNTLRPAIEATRGAEKELYKQAYAAIDPEGKLNLVTTPARDAANQIVNSMTEWTPPIENKDLKRILPKMQEMPDVMPLRHLGELDKDVTSAMFTERKANGESPDLARLTQLKGALKGAINDAVANQEKYETAAVARGEMRPEDTMESRLRRDWGLDEQVQASGQRSNAATASAGAGAGAGRPVSRGTSAPASGPGAGSEAGRGLSASTGDQGIPSGPLAPNVDEAAAARVNAAKTAYAKYAQTYKSEPVAGALKTTGPATDYKMQASALPGKAFVSGDKGYETTGAFLKAAGDSPEAVATLKDYARSLLAKKAVRPDGTLDPTGFAKWHDAHKGSLRAIEERSPGFIQEFRDAAQATDQMLTAQATRKEQLGEFQKSQAGALLGKKTPTEVENTVGQILQKKDISSIEDLLKQASKDPAALDGLRKSATDWMARTFTNDSGERWMKSAAFRKFVNERYDALAKLYGNDQANMFRAIADDLASADRPSASTASKRGPGTAKDIAPFLKKTVEAAKHTSLFNAMAVGTMGGFEAHGMKGALYGAAGTGVAYAVGTLRAAGINTMKDMFRDAISSPERARYYVSKVPQEHALSAVTRSLRRELLLSQPIGADQPVGRASGGRVQKRDYPAKKATHIEKQMNRICKAYGGELNPMLGMNDDTVARALRVANRGRFADGGKVIPEEGTVEGPTLNPFGVDPDQIRQITGLKPQGALPGPLGMFGADTAKNIVEGTANAATLPGDAYLGKADLNTPEGFARAQNMAGMITSGGMPMAETGAVGSAGGRLFDPTKYTNIDPRKSVPVNNNRTPAYQRALDEHDSIIARWEAAHAAVRGTERELYLGETTPGLRSEFEMAHARNRLDNARREIIELEPRMREPDPYYEPTLRENGGLQNILPQRIDRYFSSEGPRNAANERASGGRIALRLAYNR